MGNKLIFSRVSSIFLISLIFFSFFGVSVYAQDAPETEDLSGVDSTSEIVFSEDVAGITPQDWYDFLDFTHTPEEYYHEAGICIEDGDIEAAQDALNGMAEELAGIEADLEVEEVSVEGVTLDNFDSVAIELAGEFETALTYSEYVDILEIALDEQIANGVIDEAETLDLLNDIQLSVADVNAGVEGRRIEVIEGVAENSDASTFEVGNTFQDYAFSNDPTLQARMQAIANTQTIAEVRDQIIQLQEEANQLEAEGDTERAEAIRELLNTAHRHATECLHAEEAELSLEGFGHLQESESLLENAELIADGAEVSNVDEDVLAYTEPFTPEELVAETEREQLIAEELIEDYDSLVQEYADDPERLVALRAENVRAENARLLGQQLYGNGVMEQWRAELTADGLTGNDLERAVGERWAQEWNAVYGQAEDFFGPGMITTETEQTEGENTDAVPLGRIEVGEDGVIRGYRDGEWNENYVWAGAYAHSVPYSDPATGYIYTYGENNYVVTTRSGVSYTQEYPVGFATTADFERGNEVYNYRSEAADGTIVEYIFSTTGYEANVESSDSATEETASETEAETVETVIANHEEVALPYAEGTYIFEGDGVGLVGPISVTYTDNTGLVTQWDYDPTWETSLVNGESGQVFTPSEGTLYHDDVYNYDATNDEYVYSVADGSKWHYEGDGVWKESTNGVVVQRSFVDGPVGHENAGSYTDAKGIIWSWDSSDGTWQSSSGNVFAPPPSAYGYVAPDGTYTDYRGQVKPYVEGVVDATGKPWGFDAATGMWAASDGSKSWNMKTGECVGCGDYKYGGYYTTSEGSTAPTEVRQNTYSNSYYVYNPSGTYTQYDNYQKFDPKYRVEEGKEKQEDMNGNTWVKNADGSWKIDGSVAPSPTAPVDGSPSLSPATPSSSGRSGYAGYGSYVAGGNYNGYYGGAATFGSYAGQQGAYVARPSTIVDGTGNGIIWHVRPDGMYNGVRPDGSTVTAEEYGASMGGSMGPGASGYGGYNPAAAAAGWPGGAYPGGVAPYSGSYTGPVGGTPYNSYPGGYGTYDPATNTYSGGNYGPEGYSAAADAAAYAAAYPSSGGSYTGGSYTGGSYTGSGYTSGGSYSGTTTGSGYTGGSYTGGSYTGGSYTGGSYTGGDSGSYTSGGSYTGGSTSGDSGGSTSGSTSGGDSGGSTSGGDSGGSTGGGAVIAGEDAKIDNALIKFFKRLFGRN